LTKKEAKKSSRQKSHRTAATTSPADVAARGRFSSANLECLIF